MQLQELTEVLAHYVLLTEGKAFKDCPKDKGEELMRILLKDEKPCEKDMDDYMCHISLELSALGVIPKCLLADPCPPNVCKLYDGIHSQLCEEVVLSLSFDKREAMESERLFYAITHAKDIGISYSTLFSTIKGDMSKLLTNFAHYTYVDVRDLMKF